MSVHDRHHDLGLMVRGTSTENPVLLFLAGGPGGSERGAMRRHLPGLEEHFTVVTWDQRGAGTSYPELDPTETITLDGYVSDIIELTTPELYRAFIGAGQLVSQLAADRVVGEDHVNGFPYVPSRTSPAVLTLGSCTPKAARSLSWPRGWTPAWLFPRRADGLQRAAKGRRVCAAGSRGHRGPLTELTTTTPTKGPSCIGLKSAI